MENLRMAKVSRNLRTRARYLGLEGEDLAVVMVVAAIMQFVGRWFNRELFGISLTMLLQYAVPLLVVFVLLIVKYGRQPGFLMDYFTFKARPKIYSGRAKDNTQIEPYLQD